jgi:hypothetical protein
VSGPRRSYEARVLLVPLGPAAVAAELPMLDAGLGGVMTVRGIQPSTAAQPASPRLAVMALGEHGWRAPGADLSVELLVEDADMVVLLAADLAEVSPELCAAVAGAARADGALVAGLVVGRAGWGSPRGSTAMAALREAADMLVMVRGPQLAAAFLDVLRGGAR